MTNIVHCLTDCPAQVIKVYIDNELKFTFAIVFVGDIEIY